MTHEMYHKIRKHIKSVSHSISRALDIIDAFHSTADDLDWVMVGDQSEGGGIIIDFGSFEIKCIDYWILKYNALQNAGSSLVSVLSLIPADIHRDRASSISKGIDYIREALQILRDFDIMLQSSESTEPPSGSPIIFNSENENRAPSLKLNPYRKRVPRTFFHSLGTVVKLDDGASNSRGFKQFVLDLRCKVLFKQFVLDPLGSFIAIHSIATRD